jgi:hypothetical protein
MKSVPYSLFEEGRPQALDTPPPVDNADESGWGVKKSSVLIRLPAKQGFQAARLMRPGNTCQMLYSQLGNHCDSVAQPVKEMDKVQI